MKPHGHLIKILLLLCFLIGSITGFARTVAPSIAQQGSKAFFADTNDLLSEIKTAQQLEDLLKTIDLSKSAESGILTKGANGRLKVGSSALGDQKVLGSIVKVGNTFEYTNPAGELIIWDEQLDQGILSSIISKKNSKDAGDAVEGKVGEFVQSKKKIVGFNQIFKRSDGSAAAELDVITADEIIECKKSISKAKSTFTLNNQASKISNLTDANFVNAHDKSKILFVDEQLPRNSIGELFPSDIQYIDNLKANGIDFANSLEELEKLLK